MLEEQLQDIPQESINLLELIEQTIKSYGANNKFKFAIAENFECHKYTHIDFSENMTVFVGESSNGKSSFMRMLDWVQYNSIRGDKHITTGERECRGIIGTFNGFIVKREITPSYNRYYITHESWDKEYILEGFGVNVPYEIQVVLGAFKVKIDDKRHNDLKLNYLEQGQGWFLTSDQYPSTTKAKAVGLLYGVHYLDQAIKDTKYELDKVNKKISSTEDEIKILKEKAKAYDYLDDLKNKIELVEKAYKEGVKLKNLSDKLMDLNIKYTKACSDYENTVNLLSRIDERKINNAEMLVSEIKEKLSKLKNLSRLSKDYKFSIQEIMTSTITIERGRISAKADKLIKEIEEDIQRLKRLSRLNKNYSKTKESIKKADEHIALEDSIKKADGFLGVAIENLRKGSKLIPLSKELALKNKQIVNCDRIIDTNQDIKLADEKAKELKNEIGRMKKLQSLALPYHKVVDELDKLEAILSKTQDIYKAEERFKGAYNLFDKINRLIPLSSNYREAMEKLESLKPQLDQEVKLKKLDKLLHQVEVLFSKHETLLKLREELVKVKDNIIKENDVITEKKKELEGLISKYEGVIRELGVCPLCRSEITEDVVGHLTLELRR
jgi:exonuclease SbcC